MILLNGSANPERKKISGYVWTGHYTTLDVNFVKNMYDLRFPILNNARRHKS